MAWAWRELIELYNKLEENGDPVCPIAHTYIAVHVAVLIDADGDFLCATVPSVKGQLTPVPCTIESESRTSNVAPHLISDQLQYVSDVPGFKSKHRAYLNQLEAYVSSNPMDMYAAAVLRYASKGTVYSDIKDILPNNQLPEKNLNVLFAVYGSPYNGEDLLWTEHYLSTLEPNGICYVTGKRDYIPKTYPRNILSTNGKERLFLSGFPVGYIASQKIIHVLQYMAYGKYNHDRVDAEYKIHGYLSGSISEEDLKRWIDKEYPGKWNGFIKILNVNEA